VSRALAVLLLALPLAACSALLNPDGHPIACMGTGPSDTCLPFGMICVNGFCEHGDGGLVIPDGCGMMEMCNGIDDNCNGLYDEGFDLDNDGFTFCGTGPTGGTDISRADCNDGDPSVHPGAPEICDGKDNDCNGMTDDGACTAPEMCFVSIHACHVPDCNVPDHACSGGEICHDDGTGTFSCIPLTHDCRMPGMDCTPPEVCDPTSGACKQPQPLGAACMTDADCLSEVCLDTSLLRIAATAPRICGMACCSQSDCPAGSVCWVPGSGTRSCLPPAMLMRTPGGGAPGSSCSADSQCMSGLCGSSHDGCLSACGRSADCSGLVCTLSEPASIPGRSDYALFACVSDFPGGTQRVGQACCSPSDCRSGQCLNPGSTFGFCSGSCTEACRTDADCPRADTFAEGYCAHLGTSGTSDVFQGCGYGLPASSRPSGMTGASCSSGRDCHDNLCQDGTCHDSCCTDGDCPGGTHCRPGPTSAIMACR
jgi:hypothetical protein